MVFSLSLLKSFYRKLLHHRYGLSLCIYLGAAIATGVASVLFMRAFEFVFSHRLNVSQIGFWAIITTPLLFLVAIELIRILAPCADGAGIPQTIFAAKLLNESTYERLGALVSFKTMLVKIVALLIGLMAGASTGREGPTVHIASCLFFVIALLLHRILKLKFDMRSAVIAGGAAGLAAAFNTPLAGVTFAIEELSSDYFSNIKDLVLMAIIVAGLSAKTLTGEYAYFGRLNEPAVVSVSVMVLVGICSGIAGSFFSVALVEGRKRLTNLTHRQRFLTVIVMSWLVLLLTMAPKLNGIAGPGNVAAQTYVEGSLESPPVLFSVCKMAATLLTYWSGIAGGIFAPSLSMGSAIGAWVGSAQHASIATCAVLGMAAFLSGTIQAPITSFVIIYEMTGHHQMVLPLMLASLIGYMIAKAVRARHLYHALSEQYNRLL